jgi:hypothetical protein
MGVNQRDVDMDVTQGEIPAHSIDASQSKQGRIAGYPIPARNISIDSIARLVPAARL